MTPARQQVAEAAIEHHEAGEALKLAEAAFAVGEQTVAEAEGKLTAIGETESLAGAGLAERIRKHVFAAQPAWVERAGTHEVAAGVLRPKPVDKGTALARASATAEANEARGALDLLGRDLEVARRRLSSAGVALQLATQAVLVEEVQDLAERATEAIATYHAARDAIAAAGRIGHAQTPDGMRPMSVPARVSFIATGAAAQPKITPPAQQAALVERWRAFREALVADATTPAPVGPAQLILADLVEGDK